MRTLQQTNGTFKILGVLLEAYDRMVVLDGHEDVLAFLVRDDSERGHRSMKLPGGLNIPPGISIPNRHPVQCVVVGDIDVARRRINVHAARVFEISVFTLNYALRLA